MHDTLFHVKRPSGELIICVIAYLAEGLDIRYRDTDALRDQSLDVCETKRACLHAKNGLFSLQSLLDCSASYLVKSVTPGCSTLHLRGQDIWRAYPTWKELN
jgi:hypothetical protein